MATYFGKRLTWVKLREESELEYLSKAIAEVGYDGDLIGLDHTDEGIYALVKWPKEHLESTLTGEAYRKWEKVKRLFYKQRKGS